MSGSIPTSSISFSGIVSAYNNVNSTNLSTTNISLSSFRGKSFSDSTTVPSSGAISLNSHFKGKTWDVPITFSSHTFTNCGATGRYGPTLSECRSAYSPSWVDNTSYFNVVTQGIQEWTIPATTTYEIEVWGASGGQTPLSNTLAGRGQKIKHQFSLTEGEKLYIVVGQMGVAGQTYSGEDGHTTGGGGGSFVMVDLPVWNSQPDYPLIVAGGGNGDSWNGYSTNGPDAQTTYDDRGTPGNGGRGNTNLNNLYGRGSGGAGFYVDGIEGTPSQHGYEHGNLHPGYSTDRYWAPFTGGGGWPMGSGGYGGGGRGYAEGGGGGGWVGGDVVPWNSYHDNYPSYGAGSFIKDVDKGSVSSLGLNTGHGKVIITKL